MTLTLTHTTSQIANVYAMVLQAETTQANVETSLDQIELQQKQVSENVESFIRVVDEQQGLDVDIGPADAERDKKYGQATTVNRTHQTDQYRTYTAILLRHL
jgi:nuclear pore complex protein Nup62